MTPERWAQIEGLFHLVAECDSEDRIHLLDEACDGDSNLRQEVESLLSSEESARGRLQTTVRHGLEAAVYPLVGETVSHYRILDWLGGGGMGLVYRAEDIKLGRQVALKFLPEESAKEPAVLARFEREARSASALEHPNICPIYEFGEHEGQPFLVMQLLEGQTLRELISAAGVGKPPFPGDAFLDYAIQIASGLEAAHGHGIIHRDVKPANIFVTKQGQAKILDFGLAKLARNFFESEFEESNEAEGIPRETISGGTPNPLLSLTGVAMGTAAYMSPEQARGEKLDGRTDLFSFGLVLYEMATGQRAFKGDTEPVVPDAILKHAPVSLSQLNSKFPPKLKKIINRALEKDRDARYASATEIKADLESLKKATGRGSRRREAVAGVVALLLISTTGFWLYDRRQSASQFKPPAGPAKIIQISHWNKPIEDAKLSPDGRTVAFTSPVSGIDQVFVMLTSGSEPLQLTNDREDKKLASFSLDGNEIYYVLGFFAGADEVWALPRRGGSPTHVASGRTLISAPDGNSYFYFKSESNQIYRQPRSGLSGELIYSFARDGMLPWGILAYPDGKDLLVDTGGMNETLTNPSSKTFYKLNVSTRKAEKLGEVSGSPTGIVWGEPGKSLFFSRAVNEVTNIWEYPLYGGNLKQVTSGAGPDLFPMPDPNGQGIYFVSGRQSPTLTTYHPRARQSFNLVSETATQPALSPDGRRLAFITLTGSEHQELWASDVDGSNRVRLASAPTLETQAWSPDNSQFAYSEDTDATTKLYVVRVDGRGLRLLLWSGATVGSVTWSPGGKTLYFSSYEKDPATVTTWRATADGTKVEVLTEGCGYVGDVSPDGRYLLSRYGPGGGIGIYELSVADRKCTPLLPNLAALVVHFSSDGKSILYTSNFGGETVVIRRPWHEGKLLGLGQTTKLPFAFQGAYVGGNAYEFSKDLSTIAYSRPGGHADLYLLSQK